MKKWNKIDIISAILQNRGITTKKDIGAFLRPMPPHQLSVIDVGIDKNCTKKAVKRIGKAIKDKESIVVYTDYDADGLTAGAIVWETIHKLGGLIMPYVPHRVDEGYGLTKKGIDTVFEKYHPTLLITVDHGITARNEVEYAKSKGMDVIITDHHIKPDKLPECLIIHTTALSGAGVAWFFAKEVISSFDEQCQPKADRPLDETLSLSAIGTIADMMPLLGPNRSIAKYGLEELKKTTRVGLKALIEEAGLVQSQLTAYSISHMLAPRLNAMGRLVYALDGLRLLCTNDKDRAKELASKLGLTNRERQQLTIDTTLHAKELVESIHGKTIGKKLLFIAHESYNQGVIGLVAGKLVETYYLPSIVISKGEMISKASARSIKGFNIVEAIRSFSDLLIDVGGHPLAAGFTIETKKMEKLREKLEKLADKHITNEMLKRPVAIDLEIPLESVTEDLYDKIQQLQPFGFGNPEPVFLSKAVQLVDFRRIGAD
ncbi:single-stranded-DNA-specific exonuclease RecJ, partial [Patescibacteria group bacterium]|nr:single-stranded-DNA-specific exonuclease RecJ [Patescibacteria group bacterium]